MGILVLGTVRLVLVDMLPLLVDSEMLVSAGMGWLFKSKT